jgi:hypothetical protein
MLPLIEKYEMIFPLRDGALPLLPGKGQSLFWKYPVRRGVEYEN